ncbi:MAG: hypothetical protein ACYCVD_02005 [Desulfitobacteriaceae bacterium]
MSLEMSLEMSSEIFLAKGGDCLSVNPVDRYSSFRRWAFRAGCGTLAEWELSLAGWRAALGRRLFSLAERGVS